MVVENRRELEQAITVRGDRKVTFSGQQIRSKIERFKMLTFLFLNQTLWCDHSLESSWRDDFNDSHIIGFG